MVSTWWVPTPTSMESFVSPLRNNFTPSTGAFDRFPRKNAPSSNRRSAPRPYSTPISRSRRIFWTVRTDCSLVFPTAMVVKVKDAETKRNKASVAHTGWNKRKKKLVRKNQKRSVCNLVACNYFFNRKCANQRAIVQQENQIHRVTGLDAWRKEGWWGSLLQSFSPLSRSCHVSFSLSFPSSPAYCRFFCS